LKRVETRLTRHRLLRVDRDFSKDLTDLPKTHWGTKAAISLVDDYGVMDGYPDKTFGGTRIVSRYESAAIVSKLLRIADITLSLAVPSPTPEPTPEPSPSPSPEIVVTPPVLPTFHLTDLKFGGGYGVYNYYPNNYALFNLDFTFWRPHLIGDQTFGAYMNANYLRIVNSEIATLNNLTANWNSAAGLKWRPIGATSDEGPILTLGTGLRHIQMANLQEFSYSAVGSEANIGLELPLAPWFGLYFNDAFALYWVQPQQTSYQAQFSNHLEAGFTIPAWSNWSLQLGYQGGLYKFAGNELIPCSNPTGDYFLTENGALIRVRTRF